MSNGIDNLATGAINANGAVTVSSLTSNGAVSGTTGTFGSGVVTTTLNANGTATVNVTMNTAGSGQLIFTVGPYQAISNPFVVS